MRTNPGFAEQKEVLGKLESTKTRHPDAVIFSCGHTFAMEYLLPGSANFVLCEHFEDGAYAGKPKFLLSYALEDDRKVIYWSGKSFIPEVRDNLASVIAHCPKNDIYLGEHYSIASCDAR